MARTLPLAQRAITTYVAGHPTAVLAYTSRAAALRAFDEAMVRNGRYTADEQWKMHNALNAGKPVTTTEQNGDVTYHLPDRYESHAAPTPDNPRGGYVSTTQVASAPRERGLYREFVDANGVHTYVDREEVGQGWNVTEYVYSPAMGTWTCHRTRIENGVAHTNTFHWTKEDAHADIQDHRIESGVDGRRFPDHS